jgi:hypothetical protein
MEEAAVTVLIVTTASLVASLDDTEDIDVEEELEEVDDETDEGEDTSICRWRRQRSRWAGVLIFRWEVG